MPLYRWGADNLDPVSPTNFEAESIQEADLQRLLRDQPEVLEEGLFIIAEEYSNWQDSSRSIDLLGLDESGRLVVIELKRTQTGDHSELQAIRYAAMVANMTLEQIVEAHGRYLAGRRVDEDARIRVLDHLGVVEGLEAEIRTERPRIILASAGFSRELTTSVLWLNDNGLNIACVRFRLYRNGNDTLIDTDQVIPLPEASDYLVSIHVRKAEERRQQNRGQYEETVGGEVFLEAMRDLQDEARATISTLYEWAMSLEAQGLVRVTTRQSKAQTILRPNLPGTEATLATVYCTNTPSHLGIHGRAMDRHAPKSKEQVVEAITPEILRTDRYLPYAPYRDTGLLEALTDAYREANGLPPTIPPPGSGPGSPPLEDC